MARNKTNFFVDAIGYIAFLVLLITGIILKYILLPGSRREANAPNTLMGYARHVWGDIHFWASVVFVVVILIHLILHWKWLQHVFARYIHIKTTFGILAALLIQHPFAGEA